MYKYQLSVSCLTSLLEGSKINPANTTSLRMTVHDLSLLSYFVVDCVIIAASLCMGLAGPDSAVDTANTYVVDQFGIRTPVRARFSEPIQTGP